MGSDLLLPLHAEKRVTRLLVAGTDLLFLLFAVTLFYGLFYPDDNKCEKLRTEDVCVDLVSRYFDTNQCQWSAVSGCTLDAPPVNIQFLAFACSLIILFTVLPRRLLQLLLEKICNKRPQVEDICLSSKTMLKAEPALFYSEGETSDFTKHISLDGLPITRHLVPYPLERLDSLIVQDELNAIVLSAKKLFTTTLKTAPLPWRMDPGQKHAEDPQVKQLAAMGSIMRWMYLHPDGTPLHSVLCRNCGMDPQ